MKWIVLPIFIWISEPSAPASELHLLRVDDLSVEYWKYEPGYRNSYLLDTEGRPMQLKDGGQLNLDLTPFNYTYMNNSIHASNSMEGHPKYVGWEWEAGLRLGKVDIFQHHHSQHGLEYVNPRGDSFPLENYFGIRVRFIGEKK